MTAYEKIGLCLMMGCLYGRIVATSDMWQAIAGMAFMAGLFIFAFVSEPRQHDPTN